MSTAHLSTAVRSTSPLRLAWRAPSFWGGICIGLPIAYPDIPYYILALAVFGAAVIFSKNKVPRHYLALTACMVAVAFLSNVLTHSQVNIPRALYTSVYFSFFLFGALVANRAALLQGFVVACGTMSTAIILMALYRQPWSAGLWMFSVPELRLWGADIFPDWPNFLAFMLSCGFLLAAGLYRWFWPSILILTAALLTTSRTPLLALAIFLLMLFFSGQVSRMKVLWLSVVALIGLLLASFILSPEVGGELSSRLLLLQDRTQIYKYALELFEKNPIFGMGSVLLDESVGHVGHASYHNSYLDVLVRHGLIGIILFIALAWPPVSEKSGQHHVYWMVILFFFVAAVFQNIFKHPHLLMLYSVVLATRGSLEHHE